MDPIGAHTLQPSTDVSPRGQLIVITPQDAHPEEYAQGVEQHPNHRPTIDGRWKRKVDLDGTLPQTNEASPMRQRKHLDVE